MFFFTPEELKSILAFVLLFSVVVVSAGTFSGLSYNQNAFASSPPVVSVTSPANGATVPSSTVTITGTASSSSSTISSVQISIDGSSYVPVTGTTSWSYTANGLAAGIHSITVKATDGQGLIGYSTNIVAGTPISVGAAQELVFDPANGNIYEANYANTNTIAVISGTTNTVIATIPDSGGPTGITYDSTNGDIYTANYNSGTVTVINTATNTVAGSPISVGVHPFGVAFVPTNGKIYVSNTGSNTVSVIDPTTNTVTDIISTGTHPQDFTFDPTNGDLYVTIQGSNAISVINPSTNTITATISVGSAPRGSVYDSTNGMIYLANAGTDTVSVIDPMTNTVASTITLGGNTPTGVTLDPTNGYIYVANQGVNQISVIDSATNTVLNPITLPSGNSYYIIFDPVNSDIYTSSGSNIVRIQTQTDFTVTQITTATTLQSSQNPSTVGQSVTFTAAVTPTPTTGDTVTFYDGATNIGTGTTNSTGQATLATSLSVGSHSITATFAGDSSFVTSTSSALSQTVNKITTTTTLASSQNPSTFGQSVTITAAVSPNTATGTVTFTVDGTPQTPVTVSSGQATFNSSSLSVGSHTITAAYSGDTNDAGSTGTLSPSQVVNPISFSSFTAEVHIEDNYTHFELKSKFTLGTGSSGINPVTDNVSLQVGTFSTTIPSGSFKYDDKQYKFEGVINGVHIETSIKSLGSNTFELKAEAEHANMKGTTNPVSVQVTIGNNSDTTTVNAMIDVDHDTKHDNNSGHDHNTEHDNK